MTFLCTSLSYFADSEYLSADRAMFCYGSTLADKFCIFVQGICLLPVS